jgi:hypothetical protein
VDDVLLDLSAGTGYNVLDFFLAAQQPILVVVPEPTAIDNAYQFLKAAFFRSLASATKNKSVRAAIERALEPRGEGGPGSPRELIAGVMAHDPLSGLALEERALAFCPWILVNEVSTREQRNVTARLDLAVASNRRGGANGSANGARKAASVVAKTPDLPGPDAYLRHCREQLALGPPELYARTRIRSLSSVENERFEDLPSGFYVRGFVLQYARALGIQEAGAITSSFLERYRQARAGARG